MLKSVLLVFPSVTFTNLLAQFSICFCIPYMFTLAREGKNKHWCFAIPLFFRFWGLFFLLFFPFHAIMIKSCFAIVNKLKRVAYLPLDLSDDQNQPWGLVCGTLHVWYGKCIRPIIVNENVFVFILFLVCLYYLNFRFSFFFMILQLRKTTSFINIINLKQ